jgi:hypothetical protein
MKPQDSAEFKWVGTDLHVHTPASKDYKGSRSQTEYLSLIRSANEFGSPGRSEKKSGLKKDERKPIGCIAFTDHNSVEGFRTYRQVLEETEKLSKGVRSRDPENILVTQLEQDLDTLRSIRVLMGVEIKADPGIHALVIFAESVEPSEVVTFLESGYQAPYLEFQGEPAPGMRWTLKQTLDQIQEIFTDRAFVVFPHVDSSGGVYEDLKEFAPARISALTHPIVKALSFNRQETRDRLKDLLKQPDYARPQPLSLIQSSDFHGKEGTSIGQPRTEVCARDGKPTFKNLKEAFREQKVKCSIDFIAEDYQASLKDRFVAKYVSDRDRMEFKQINFDDISESICGMLNSSGGIIELEGDVTGAAEQERIVNHVRDQLKSILDGKLAPPFEPTQYRFFQFSPGKVRVLCLIPQANRLYLAIGKAFTNKNNVTRPATPNEIEFVVSRNLDTRFGRRFEGTLKGMSRASSLLSRLPHGIPVILSCHHKMELQLPDTLKVSHVSPASDKGAEAAELFEDVFARELDLAPFGACAGNASILYGSKPPRQREHYMRFTVARAEVREEVLQKAAWGKIEHNAIFVDFRGAVGLVEPGYILSAMPSVLIEPEKEWQENVYSLLGWWKSAFFIWYCAVRLGEASPFIELQRRPFRIPIPRIESTDFLRAMSGHVKNVISEEHQFMSEMMRHKKKGDLDLDFQEKSRRRHNLALNRTSLAMDKEVFKFLEVNEKDQRFILETLRDLGYTDFGLLDELEGRVPDE